MGELIDAYLNTRRTGDSASEPFQQSPAVTYARTAPRTRPMPRVMRPPMTRLQDQRLAPTERRRAAAELRAPEYLPGERLPPSNQFREAGEQAFEMTGLPAVRRGARETARAVVTDSPEDAPMALSELGLGALNALSLPSLLAGGGPRGARPTTRLPANDSGLFPRPAPTDVPRPPYRRLFAQSGHDYRMAQTPEQAGASGAPEVPPYDPNAIAAERWTGPPPRNVTPRPALDANNRQGLRVDPSENNHFRHGDAEITYDVLRNGDVEIRLLRTPSEAQGQGQARAAMEAFLARPELQGRRLSLVSEPQVRGMDGERLTRFYESLGFERLGSRGDMVRSPRPEAPQGGMGASQASDGNASPGDLPKLRRRPKSIFTQPPPGGFFAPGAPRG